MNILRINQKQILEKTKELRKQGLIPVFNYGLPIVITDEEVIISSHRPFPAYEPLSIISSFEEKLIGKEKEKIINAFKKVIPDELDAVFYASEFIAGNSKIYGFDFHYDEEILIAILDALAKNKKAKFSIREQWDTGGDLLGKFIQIESLEEKEESFYTASLIKLQQLPPDKREKIKDYCLHNGERFLSIFEEHGNDEYTFVLVLDKYPTNYETFLDFYDEYSQIEREKNLFKIERFLSDISFEHIKVLKELLNNIKNLKEIEDIDIVSIIKLIKLKLRTIKPSRKSDFIEEKNISFIIENINFPVNFKTSF